MRICYLLETTEMSGGVRVVFDQARALAGRGHQIFIRALRGDHSWYHRPLSVDYVADLSEPVRDASPAPDIVVATFWTTVGAALKKEAAAVFHLCQGYEGDTPEFGPMKSDIENAYRNRIPKLTVGRWLNSRLREVFGPGQFETHDIGQIVDVETFRPPLGLLNPFGPFLHNPVRVLIVGMFESSFKGLRYAAEAVRLMRASGVQVYLIRVSPVPCPPQEAAFAPIDEYHVHLSPEELAAIYRKSDIFLSPSLWNEGFGLPLAEALASGLPAVATTIPSYLSFDDRRDYALFVPEKDPDAMAQGALELIRNRPLRKRLSKRGREIVLKKFRSEIVAGRLETVFSNALEGAPTTNCKRKGIEKNA